MTATLTRPVHPGNVHTGARRRTGPGATPRISSTEPGDRVRAAGSESPGSTPDTEDQAHTLPDPGRWAGTLVHSTVEVLSGARPVAQLTRWLSPELFETVSRRAGLAHRLQRRSTAVRRPHVRRVHTCRISADVVEASVVLHDGAHMRAAAVRLEAHRGRWRATALQIG